MRATGRSATPRRSWFLVKAVFATSVVCVVIAFLGFADGETVRDGGPGMLLFWGPWWLDPVAIYVVFVRTLIGSIVAGLGLFVGSALALAAVFDDTHSTAGLGIAFFPIYFALAIGAYLMVEWGALTLVRRARHRTR